MRNILLALALGALICTGPAAAREAALDGWYGDLGLGVVIARDMPLNGAGAAAEFDLGAPIGSLAVGREFGPSWRLELEYAYRDNDLETFLWPDADTEVGFGPNDGVKTSSLLVNGLRDLRLGAFEPYFGAGLGYARVRFRMSEGATVWPVERPRIPILDDSADALALQLIAGFELPLGEQLNLGFDYRLWHAPDVRFRDASGARLDLSHTTHSAQAHLRYRFGSDRRYREGAPPAPTRGGYLGVSLGSGFPIDAEIADSQENLDAFQVGPVLSLSAGYRITPRWRLELALEKRKNLVEVVDFGPPTGQFAASGRVRATSLMANAAYDFRPRKPVRPFVGGGLGAARLDYRIETRDSRYLDDEATAPALQLFAGLGVAMTERLEFVAEFRTWFSGPVDMRRPDGGKLETWHWVHALHLGLRMGSR